MRRARLALDERPGASVVLAVLETAIVMGAAWAAGWHASALTIWLGFSL